MVYLTPIAFVKDVWPLHHSHPQIQFHSPPLTELPARNAEKHSMKAVNSLNLSRIFQMRSTVEKKVPVYSALVYAHIDMYTFRRTSISISYYL